MQYLTKPELRRLLETAKAHNKLHHLALLVGFWHGLRVSELCNLKGADISDGQINVRRMKRSRSTLQPLHYDSDPLLDESPLAELAKGTPGNLFPFTRQWVDQFVKKYAKLAGIHPDKAHFHVLKHSIAMALFDDAQSLGQVQSYLGHKAASSTLAYLYEADASKAHKIVERMKI